LGETILLKTKVQFARTIVKVFGLEYLRKPIVEDTERLLAIGKSRRSPVMLCSLDCIYCIWKKYLAWAIPRSNQRGHHHTLSSGIEGLVDLVFFGTLGSNNDINVLQ